MEESESSINRIGRTIWTVWGYLSGTVGRYLRPEAQEEQNQNQNQSFQENENNSVETESNVTVRKSLKEVKQPEEERSETTGRSQSERVQTGVSVRSAAVQWEKSHVRKDATKKRTCVEWNTEVQEEPEKRNNEDKNNEAPKQEDNSSAASSTNTINQDSKTSRSVEAKTSKNIDDELIKREDVGSEAKRDVGSEEKREDVGSEEKREDVGSEEKRDVGSDEKREDVGSEERRKDVGDEEKREDVGSEERREDVGSEEKREDVVSEEKREDVEEEEKRDVGSEEKREDVVSEEKREDVEEEEKREDVGSEGKREDVGCEEKREDVGDEEKREDVSEERREDVGDEEKREDVSEERREDVGSDEKREHVGSEKKRDDEEEQTAMCGLVDEDEKVMESSINNNEKNDKDLRNQELSDDQGDLISQTTFSIKDILNSPSDKNLRVEEMTEQKTTLTPEQEVISVSNEETKQEIVGTIMDVQYEAGQQLTQFKAVGISKLEETQTELVEATLETECQRLENPEICKKDQEPVGETIENKAIVTTEREVTNVTSEETKLETVGTIRSEQISEFVGTELVDFSEPKLEETQTELVEKTECERLEEPMMENAEICDKNLESVGETIENKVKLTTEREVTNIISEETKLETVGTITSSPQEEDEQICKFVGTQIVNKLDENLTVFTEKIVETEYKEPANSQTKHEEICVNEVVGVSEPKLEETQTELVEATLETECQRLENSAIFKKDQELFGKTIEHKAIMTNITSEETKLETGGTIRSSPQEEEEQICKLVDSEIVDLSESKPEETQTELLEEPLEEPVMDNAELCKKDIETIGETIENKAVVTTEREVTNVTSKETKLETLETIQSCPQEEEEQISKFVDSELDDIFESKLEETQTELVVETKCLEGPVMENAEMCEKDLETIGETIENKAIVTTEKEVNNIISEETKLETVGTIRCSPQEEDEQISKFVGTKLVDISESKLEETQTKLVVETKCLEEPVMENAEICDKNLEPVGKTIENKAEVTNIISEETKLETVGAITSEQISEFLGTKLGDISEPKLEETQTVLVKINCLDEPVMENAQICEAIVTTEREVTKFSEETKLETVGTVQCSSKEEDMQLSEFIESVGVSESKLEEPQTELEEAIEESKHQCLEEPGTRLENAEICEKRLKPFAKTIENKAVVSPEQEVIKEICKTETEKKSLLTPEEELISVINGDPNQLSVLNVKVSKIVDEEDVLESKLNETEGIIKTESEPLEESVTRSMESKEINKTETDTSGRMHLTVKEDHLDLIKDITAQNTSEEELCDDITRSETPEQDNESVSDGGNANQMETSETTSKLQQGFRTEVEAAEVKKSAETRGSLHVCEDDIVQEELLLQEVSVKQRSLQKSDFRDVNELGFSEMQSEANEIKSDSVTQVEAVDEVPRPSLQKESIETRVEFVAELISFQEEKLEVLETQIELPPMSKHVRSEGKYDEAESSTHTSKIEQESSSETVETTELSQAMGQSSLEQVSFQEKSDIRDVNELGFLEAPFSEMQSEAKEVKSDSITPVEAVDELPRPSLQEKSIESVGLVAELISSQEAKLEVFEPQITRSERKHEQGESVLHTTKIEQESSSETLETTEMPQAMGQSSLERGSLHEKSDFKDVNELGFSEMQSEAKEISLDSVIPVEAFDELPSRLLQEESVETSVGLVAELINSQEEKLEVLETQIELSPMSKHVRTSVGLAAQLISSQETKLKVFEPQITRGERKHEQGETETHTSKIEQESSSEIVETTEMDQKWTEVKAPASQSLLDHQLNNNESTIRETQPHELKVGSSEIAEKMMDMPSSSGESGGPDKSVFGFLDELKLKTSSLAVMEDISGLAQNPEEQQSEPSEETENPELVLTKTKKEILESVINVSQSTTHLSSSNAEDEKNFEVETMDIKQEACLEMKSTDKSTSETPKHNPDQDNPHIVDKRKETTHQNKEDKVDGKAGGDDVEKSQVRIRFGLKRGFDKTEKDKEEDKQSKAWARDLLQVSSLDCTVQKSKIAVKNPLIRPPKDPRTLINMPSVEPLVPKPSPQSSPLRTGPARAPQRGPEGTSAPQRGPEGTLGPQRGPEGTLGPQKGVIGFKLPGLGAGLPVLRKTEAGRKIRDGENTACRSAQESDTKQEQNQIKQEQPANKPRWTPPKHPGMGSPLMMSELKNKLKKTGKD